MRNLLLGICGLALATSAVLADPQDEREALMKANGKAMGALAPIVKGEQDFDASFVMQTLTKLNEDVQKIDVAALWPVGSDKGDTTSSPKIWEDMAGFQAKMDKLKADTAAAVAAAPADLDALKVQFGAVASNCGGCHEAYRIKKS